MPENNHVPKLSWEELQQLTSSETEKEIIKKILDSGKGTEWALAFQTIIKVVSKNGFIKVHPNAYKLTSENFGFETFDFSAIHLSNSVMEPDLYNSILNHPLTKKISEFRESFIIENLNKSEISNEWALAVNRIEEILKVGNPKITPQEIQIRKSQIKEEFKRKFPNDPQNQSIQVAKREILLEYADPYILRNSPDQTSDTDLRKNYQANVQKLKEIQKILKETLSKTYKIIVSKLQEIGIPIDILISEVKRPESHRYPSLESVRLSKKDLQDVEVQIDESNNELFNTTLDGKRIYLYIPGTSLDYSRVGETLLLYTTFYTPYDANKYDVPTNNIFSHRLAFHLERAIHEFTNDSARSLLSRVGVMIRTQTIDLVSIKNNLLQLKTQKLLPDLLDRYKYFSTNYAAHTEKIMLSWFMFFILTNYPEVYEQFVIKSISNQEDSLSQSIGQIELFERSGFYSDLDSSNINNFSGFKSIDNFSYTVGSNSRERSAENTAFVGETNNLKIGNYYATLEEIPIAGTPLAQRPGSIMTEYNAEIKYNLISDKNPPRLSGHRITKTSIAEDGSLIVEYTNEDKEVSDYEFSLNEMYKLSNEVEEALRTLPDCRLFLELKKLLNKNVFRISDLTNVIQNTCTYTYQEISSGFTMDNPNYQGLNRLLGANGKLKVQCNGVAAILNLLLKPVFKNSPDKFAKIEICYNFTIKTPGKNNIISIPHAMVSLETPDGKLIIDPFLEEENVFIGAVPSQINSEARPNLELKAIDNLINQIKRTFIQTQQRVGRDFQFTKEFGDFIRTQGIENLWSTLLNVQSLAIKYNGRNIKPQGYFSEISKAAATFAQYTKIDNNPYSTELIDLVKALNLVYES